MSAAPQLARPDPVPAICQRRGDRAAHLLVGADDWRTGLGRVDRGDQVVLLVADTEIDGSVVDLYADDENDMLLVVLVAADDSPPSVGERVALRRHS